MTSFSGMLDETVSSDGLDDNKSRLMWNLNERTRMGSKVEKIKIPKNHYTLLYHYRGVWMCIAGV